MLRSRRGDISSFSGLEDGYEMVTAPLIKPQQQQQQQRGAIGSLFVGGRRTEQGCFYPLKRFLRWSYQQWSLMSSCWRTVAAAMIILSATFLLLEIVDLIYQYQSLDDHGTSKGLSTETSFSVVINTYKRPKALQEAVQHYAVTCGRSVGIQSVFVIWSELDQTPPEPTSLLFLPQELVRRKPHDKPSNVVILRMTTNSLNTRFLPIRQLTSNAVFMVDDDVRVSCRSLRHGFQAWSTVPDAMVGYYPRLAATTTTVHDQQQQQQQQPSQEFVYYSWPTVFLRQRFNFVLTKASFFHRKYLELYSSDLHPQEIRNYVDRFKNCEDVAMSLLVANATTTKPVYVEGSVADKGLFGGISTGSGHMARRSKCLTDLTLVYQQHGWGSPLEDSAALRKNAWTHHAFAWQYKPANVFEWFALGNVFK